jgi:hypothetical protein
MLVEVSTGVVALSTVQNVKRWVEEESQDKKKQPMDWSGWDSGGEGGLDKTMVHEECPTQHNGFDCGCALRTALQLWATLHRRGKFGISACTYVVCRVFMCQCARHIASDAEPADDFPYSQEDMPSIRWQMAHEILQGCATAFSSSKRRRKRTSSFKGVSFCATTRKKAKWRVDFMFKGKKSPVKFFVEEKAAAQHYNAIRCSAVCNSPLCSGRCLRGTNLLDSSE